MLKGLLIVLLLVLGSSIFAQRTTRPIKSAISNYNLTINVNVSSYGLWLDNQQIKGNRITVTQGMHSIIVKADGYQDWTGSVNIERNQVVNVNLIPYQYRLTINSNVNSTIYINNRMVAKTGFNGLMNPGNYSVTIKAKGYIDYNTVVNLNRDTAINGNLQPLMANVTIFIPQSNTNTHKGASPISIYDNGMRINGYNFQATPGNHNIRVQSGGFAVEGNFDFIAGRDYTLSTGMFLQLK